MAELSTVARPYAQALFAAVARTERAAVEAELNGLAHIAAQADVAAAAKDPRMNKTSLLTIVKQIHKTELSAPIANFLSILVENGRVSLLPEIAAQYRVLKNMSETASDALITSAFPINDTQVSELMASLGKKFGVQLKPTVVVDASLIGGVRVKVGDQVLDSSVRGQLDKMRVALAA